MSSIVSLRPNFDLNDVSSLALDLANPKPKDVMALVEAFDAAVNENPTSWDVAGFDRMERNHPNHCG